jgi:two-component system, response regulator YesN
LQIIKTLIVDDEPRIRRGLERLILSCGEGFKVVATAGDGIEALEYMQQTHGAVDLLITDVRMPEMDGLTLIEEAKKRYSFYPLLISGYDDFAYVQTALRQGALDYLLKPVDREQFRIRLMEIQAIIRHREHESQKRAEMERAAGKLKSSRQTQTLSNITAAGIDIKSLGYWVDDFPPGKYLLQYICLDLLPVKSRGYTTRDWKAYFYALENIIEEVVSTHVNQTNRLGWRWRGTESDFWTLLCIPDMESEWAEEALELSGHIRSAVQTYSPFTVSISYGNPVDDLYLLPEAKRQAHALMNYRFLYGGNQVFHPMLAAQSGAILERKDVDLTSIIQELKRSVEMGIAEEAAECSKQLFGKLERAGSPALVQTAAQNVIMLIHAAGMETYGGFTHPTSVEQELAKIKNAASLHDLKQSVNRFIAQVIRDIQKSRASANMKPVQQAKDWIVKHLNEELTIKKIADHVHMNPTYFCEYFKMQTGQTILDYLTGKRLEKARDLLRDPNLKLREVSLLVGYHDVKYFSRLFKQWSGQTPSKFRDQELTFHGGERPYGSKQ